MKAIYNREGDKVHVIVGPGETISKESIKIAVREGLDFWGLRQGKEFNRRLEGLKANNG